MVSSQDKFDLLAFDRKLQECSFDRANKTGGRLMPRDSNCNPSINCMQIYINNEIYWQKDANVRARKHYQNGIFLIHLL